MQPNARRTGLFEEHRFRCSCCQEWVHPFSCFSLLFGHKKKPSAHGKGLRHANIKKTQPQNSEEFVWRS